MKPGPSSISQIIMQSLGLEAPPAPLVEVIVTIIGRQGWATSDAEACEKAEAWQRATLQHLRGEIDALQKVGRPPKICFNSSSDYMVQGACYIERKDPEDLREKKRRRSRSEDYNRVLRTLNPNQFETLCGKLIGLLGVQNPNVTRSCADEGIDFYGRLSLGSIFFPKDLTPTIQRQLSIWLVGQAKRYVSLQSGTSEIRDLVGAITLGRANAIGSLDSPFPDLTIRVGDPVFALFLTTGTISSNAWRLLQRSGVIGMDGEMIAAFLADREAGIGASSFDSDAFCRWLDE
jgi:hypothetical protein